MRWFVIGLLAGCSGDDEPTDVQPDGDADTDADSDADADADADADTDTDADADTTGATGDTGGPAVFTLSSPDLASSAGDPLAAQCAFLMPQMFSCEGPNPEIAWAGAPAGTVGYALIMDDPDASFFAHWAIYNVPVSEPGLDRGISGASVSPHVLPAGAAELRNDVGDIGYYGSCPPTAHVYRWRLWALDAVITPASNDFGALEAEANAHSLGSVGLCHIFRP